MAINDMVVRILGDSKSVERAFARSSNHGQPVQPERRDDRREADSNAKKFSGFAKGAAAGFGGAVAFNAAINGIRSVALAAAESQQVLGQTRVALESTGKSWETVRRRHPGHRESTVTARRLTTRRCCGRSRCSGATQTTWGRHSGRTTWRWTSPAPGSLTWSRRRRW